jgi:purine-binding chemotaxis protein CheW
MQTSELRDENTRELAIFMVGDMPCGLDTELVQEIIKNSQITVVHRAPEFVTGVINLRGEIATVIDLRIKFQMPPSETGQSKEIVVVRHGDEAIGLLVDGVNDVVIANMDSISPPPSNVGNIAGAFFDGIFAMEQELVSVLNPGELLKDQ